MHSEQPTAKPILARQQLDLVRDYFLKCATFYTQWTTEAALLRKTNLFLEMLGRHAYVIREAAAVRSGVPDIVLCFNGRFVALELKDDEGQPTAQQRKHLLLIEEAGGVKGVVRTLADIYRLLENCL